MGGSEELSGGANTASRAALIFALLLFACVAVYAVASALYPSATGESVLKDSGLVIDASHRDQGYVMCKFNKSSKRLKLQVTKDGTTLTYDLNQTGEYETFPLQMGSGTYRFQLYRQTSGNRYSSVAAIRVKAEIADETLPFLYPNQLCWYTPESEAVSLGEELCQDASDAQQKADNVYAYIVRNTVYDYIRALTVKSDYLPDVDDIVKQKKGICFDIAALMACMLRTQGVPTQLVIGYADSQYHAWNNVLIAGSWVRYDATSRVTSTNVKQYTTERVY